MTLARICAGRILPSIIVYMMPYVLLYAVVDDLERLMWLTVPFSYGSVLPFICYLVLLARLPLFPRSRAAVIGHIAVDVVAVALMYACCTPYLLVGIFDYNMGLEVPFWNLVCGIVLFSALKTRQMAWVARNGSSGTV